MRINRELVLQIIIIVLLVVVLVRHGTAKCYCGVKPAAAPAGYMDRDSVYVAGSDVYPQMGVAPSQANAYQILDNCYQNGGVFDFETGQCRYDYQNTSVINNYGFSNPHGRIVQEYAHRGNRAPINSMLPI